MKFGLLAFTLAALTGPVAAQVSSFPFSCAADTSQRPVRAEGKTELVGDVFVSCSGGTPTAPGQPIPTTNFTLIFNANVTSKILGPGNASEALLLVDDPAPGAQFPCTLAVCPATGNGTGTGYYGPPGGTP